MSTIENTEPEETVFRQLLSILTKNLRSRGDTPDWPIVVTKLFEIEFNRKRKIWYDGQSLFVPRDDRDHTKAIVAEKAKTRLLFKLCRESEGGCLNIAEDAFWLISYEGPTFGRTRQFADLLGLSKSGGLVVFECKLENPYAPVTSVIEGLDYLSCLTAEPNWTRFQTEFEQWRKKPNQIIPAGFESVCLNPDGPHEVIVLGNSAYFDIYRTDPKKNKNTRRGLGWTDFAAACQNLQGNLRVRFAETNYASTTGKWITQ